MDKQGIHSPTVCKVVANQGGDKACNHGMAQFIDMP